MKCIESLAAHGANIDYNISHLGTPLYVACKNQQVACAKKLLESGKAKRAWKWKANYTTPKDPPVIQEERVWARGLSKTLLFWREELFYTVYILIVTLLTSKTMREEEEDVDDNIYTFFQGGPHLLQAFPPCPLPLSSWTVKWLSSAECAELLGCSWLFFFWDHLPHLSAINSVLFVCFFFLKGCTIIPFHSPMVVQSPSQHWEH